MSLKSIRSEREKLKESGCYCSWHTARGLVEAAFNIYQSKTGAIALSIGNRYTLLSLKQINELSIDCYSLIGFDHDAYIGYYKTN